MDPELGFKILSMLRFISTLTQTRTYFSFQMYIIIICCTVNTFVLQMRRPTTTLNLDDYILANLDV